MSTSDVVIRVEGLGKKYSLHHQRSERDTHLRDVLVRQARAAGRLLNPFTLAGQLRKAQQQVAQEQAASEEEFWALKDVSFEIRRGERVGIIGRNGAGKSTLLKILSRITEPTTGRVEIRGRVASLLEVGTGFHPELTGRENIYLNGAILGMSRREIRSKFDEIVDFAEVEKFLDTPVKRYSSGMYVRLAFAVAAHLEPEILVVDEVLAVGDASFQKKCLGKMEDVSNKQGRTLLFVSHNLPSVQGLCTRSLLLEKGVCVFEGKPQQAIERYLHGGMAPAYSRKLNDIQTGRRGSRLAKFAHICIRRDDGQPAIADIMYGEPFSVEIAIYSSAKIRDAAFGISFVSQDGIEIMGSTATDCGISNELQPGITKLSCKMPENILLPGRWAIRGAIFAQGEVCDHIDEMLVISISEASNDTKKTLVKHKVGYIYSMLEWCYL